MSPAWCGPRQLLNPWRLLITDAKSVGGGLPFFKTLSSYFPGRSFLIPDAPCTARSSVQWESKPVENASISHIATDDWRDSEDIPISIPKVV
jgi:hypothetical protein